MTTLIVLVPKPETRPAVVIDAGSGIVTTAAAPGDLIEVYFEGNRYGAENLRGFEACVRHAADRLTRRYPTIARGVFRRDEFFVVGELTYDEATWPSEPVLDITDDAILAAWTMPR